MIYVKIVGAWSVIPHNYHDFFFLVCYTKKKVFKHYKNFDITIIKYQTKSLVQLDQRD